MFQNSDSKYIKIGFRDKATMIVKSVLVMFIVDWFFYRKLMMLLPLSILGIGFFMLEYREKKRHLKIDARNQFKEMLLLSSNSQKAGYSIENAMLESYKDLSRMYGKDSFICILIRETDNCRKNRVSIGKLFRIVGSDLGMQEVTEFGEIYEIAYEKSGNISKIMEKTAEGIVKKLETENEIYLSLSERKFELNIMDAMPFLIMLYISVTSRGYFDEMYKSIMGMCAMTICLIVYIFAYIWGRKLMRIEI